MLNFDGKGQNYDLNKNKEPPNKEVSPNRFQVESLYKVHRQRVLGAKPTFKSHVEIPDFLTNSTWKEQAKVHEQQRIAAENETIYKRISKAENAESLITKENREHIRRVEHELILMERLKQMGRARGVIRVNRENEDILTRIERARPQYSKKATKEWYKHHELFKKGRKSDPTAGHLGFRGMQGLMPRLLPPMHGERSNLDLAMERAEAQRRRDEGSQSLSPHRLSNLTSFDGRDGPSSTSSSISSFSPLASLGSPIKAARRTHSSDSPSFTGSSSSSTNALLITTLDSDASYVAAHSGSGGNSNGKTKKRRKKKKGPAGATASEASTRASSPTGFNNMGGNGRMSPPGSSSSKSAGLSGTGVSEWVGDSQGSGAALRDDDGTPAGMAADPSSIVLLSRFVMVPFESVTIILQILVARQYEECLRVRLLQSTPPHAVLCEREVDIDDAFEIIATHGSMLVYSDTMDLKSLRGQLIGLFAELDDDDSGFLSFDEFEELMSRSQVGIGGSDLRKVLEESDDNGNGVVDYDEFIPLAIDMIQGFRAKSNAADWVRRKDTQVDEEVLRQMSKIDMGLVIDTVLLKVYEADPKKTGSVRVSDLRKNLTLIAAKVGLTDSEVSYIMRNATRDGGMGRVKYDNIGELLTRSRFLHLKYVLLEETGSETYKYLLKLCRAREQAELDALSSSELGAGGLGEFSGPAPGLLSLKGLTNLLRQQTLFPLTTLQAAVLVSPEAASQDGSRVDYQKALGVIAKSIDILLDPKILRQRAELIDPLSLSLSSESILQVQQQEEHDKKLREKTNANTSANAQASASNNAAANIKAAHRKSTAGQGGTKNSSPASSRANSAASKETSGSGAGGGDSTTSRSTRSSGRYPSFTANGPGALSAFERRLKALFTSADKDKSDTLNEREFSTCLLSMDLRLTPEEMKSLLSLADHNHDGEVSFTEFCAFFAQNLAGLERMKHMRELHASLHRVPETGAFRDNDDDAPPADISLELADELLAVFRASDPDMTDTVSIEELQTLLSSLDINISSIQTDILISEAAIDAAGRVKYVATIPVLVDLLTSYVSKEEAATELQRREESAHLRAHDICLSSASELYTIVSYLYENGMEIEASFDASDTAGKYSAIRSMVYSPHSHLTQTEATYLMAKLYTSDPSRYLPYGEQAEHDHLTSAHDRRPTIKPHHVHSHHLPAPEAKRRKDKHARQAKVLVRIQRKRAHALTFDKNTHAWEQLDSQSEVSTDTAGHHRGSVRNSDKSHGSSKSHHSSSHSHSHSGHSSPHTPHQTQTHAQTGSKKGTTNSSGQHHPSRHNSFNSSPSSPDQQRANQSTPARTLEELTDAVFDARKLTLMRGMLQNVPEKVLEKIILAALTHSRDVLALQGKLPPHSIYVPVRECFVLLEETAHFRLTRPQVLGLIAWADCFDAATGLVDFASFAVYAAGTIKRLHSPQVQETRSQILAHFAVEVRDRQGRRTSSTSGKAISHSHSHSHSEDGSGSSSSSSSSHPNDHIHRSALNGLPEEEMDEYLVSSFTALEDERQEVSTDDFISVVVAIPSVKLTAKDAGTIAASFPHTLGGRIYWPEFLPFAHATLTALCVERLLARRMVLGGTSLSSDRSKVAAEITANLSVKKGRSTAPSNNPAGHVSTPPSLTPKHKLADTEALESMVGGEDGEERSEEAVQALKKIASAIVDHIRVRVTRDRLSALLPDEEEEQEDEQQMDEDGDLASLDSLEAGSLEDLESPNVDSILRRRRPREIVMWEVPDDDDGEQHGDEGRVGGPASDAENPFRYSPSPMGKGSKASRGPPPEVKRLLEGPSRKDVSCVDLFRGPASLSTVLLKPAAKNKQGQGGSGNGGSAAAHALNGRNSPASSSPQVTRRKQSSFVAPAVNPANSGLLQVTLRVVCPEPEVLTLDRSLIVSASCKERTVLDRNTFTSAAGNDSSLQRTQPINSNAVTANTASVSASLPGARGSGMPSLVTIAPFDVTCESTVPLPSLCLIDANQAKAFAATLWEQMYLEVAADGSVVLKVKDASFYH